MEGTSKKVQSGNDRQKKFKEKNPNLVKLNQLKQSLARTKIKETNPDKAEAIKEANKKRKQKQRNKENRPPNAEQSRDSGDFADVSLLSEDEGNSRRKNRRSSGDFSDVSMVTEDQGASSAPIFSRQQIAGFKLRKKNDKVKGLKIEELKVQHEEMKQSQDKHDDMLAELDFKIKELEVENEKAMKRIKELEEENSRNKDKWFALVYKNLTPDGRREVRNAFTVAAPEMDNGTITRLRKNTGINFSNLTANQKEVETELKEKVLEFSERNTTVVPDKKKYAKGVRFRMSSLLCLFNTFETEHPNICSYQTFCKYWPAHYVKPRASEFGTCLCTLCQNMELKFISLQTRKLLSPFLCLENIIENTKTDDFEMENEFKSQVESLADDDKKDIDIAFQQWEKVKQSEVSKNTGKVKGDKTMRMAKHLPAADLGKQILEECEKYKNHLERDNVMKNEIKKVRLEAMEEDDLAVLHVDWAEQHKLTEVKEIQTAFFNGRYSYDIHTGYCYTKEDSHGFASLSDSSDHRAEAIRCALRPKIVSLMEKGKTRFVICSDSPTSQYRNSKNVWLMKKLAQDLNISIRLLFTEAGHGKSPCDGVGGNMKTQVEDVMLTKFGDGDVEPIHSAENVKQLIEEKTNLTYEIAVHTKEDIELVKESMPKLGPLVGAMKVHEVMISPDGVIKKKDLPNETFYKPVNIRESRQKKVTAKEPEHEIDENQDMDEAFIDQSDNDESNNDEFNRTNRIMTDEEIAAVLEDEDSSGSEYNSDY